jgi:hypothetical protein
MRVRVDPKTLDPTGPPEFIAAIDNADDFCIDEDAGFAYVTRHRGNTLDRVPLAPRHGSEVRHIAGDPFDPVVVGPSSAYWGREPGDVGKVMYVTTDGGTTAPPDGIVRNAAPRARRTQGAYRVVMTWGGRASNPRPTDYQFVGRDVSGFARILLSCMSIDRPTTLDRFERIRSIVGH